MFSLSCRGAQWAPLTTIAFLLPSSVHAAQGHFSINTHLNHTDTIEGIELSVSPSAYGPSGTCPYYAFGCLQTQITVHVTPCPPETPCSNGEYVFTLNHYYHPPVILNLATQTTYTFSGTSHVDVGPQATPCSYTCSHDETIETSTYTTWSPAGKWDIQVLSSNEDTTVVELKPKDVNTSSPCALNTYAYCMQQEYSFSMSPCPLWMSQTVSNDCDSEGKVLGGNSWPNPTRIGMRTGETYTIRGSFSTYGYAQQNGGGCAQLWCNDGEVLANLSFKAGTVAVRPTTWGRIKAMYRQ